jgi:hypothetical protein
MDASLIHERFKHDPRPPAPRSSTAAGSGAGMASERYI